MSAALPTMPLPAQTRSLRVLFVAPYVPSAIRVRPFHLLRSLVARGHRITLVCIAGEADADAVDALRPLCSVVTVSQSRAATARACLQALPGPLPLQAAYSLGTLLVDSVRQTLQRRSFDIVHVEHLRGAEAALMAVRRVTTAPPLVLDAVDSISLLFERTLRASLAPATRALALLDLARTRRYEAAYGRRFDHVLTTSPEDRWALAVLRETFGEPPGTPISVVPNGVDLSYFQPADAPCEPETVVFTGKMSYHANEAAALYLLRVVMPMVWRVRPQAKVIIAGAGPGSAILAHTRDSRVTVTGRVPDLRPYLARATVAVAPIRYGVGVQNKVLEAMAMGTPVVAARQATVALTARPGNELLVADEAAGFAAQILALLDSPEQRALIAKMGRRYVERHHSWSASVATLEDCYLAAMKRHARA